MDVRNRCVGLTLCESASVAIQGWIALEVDVEGYAASHAVAEGGARGHVVGIEELVGQVVAAANGSRAVGEREGVRSRGGGCFGRVRKAGPALPLIGRIITAGWDSC